ncbi:hypothetical protein VUR80DRAFT_6083 [Thermomyces stellatus]
MQRGCVIKGTSFKMHFRRGTIGASPRISARYPAAGRTTATTLSFGCYKWTTGRRLAVFRLQLILWDYDSLPKNLKVVSSNQSVINTLIGITLCKCNNNPSILLRLIPPETPLRKKKDAQYDIGCSGGAMYRKRNAGHSEHLAFKPSKDKAPSLETEPIRGDGRFVPPFSLLASRHFDKHHQRLVTLFRSGREHEVRSGVGPARLVVLKKGYQGPE